MRDRRKEWNAMEKGQWMKILIKEVTLWATKKFGSIGFYHTQVLTDHGCFGHYLFKFKKRQTAECVDYKADTDDAAHMMFQCNRWRRARIKLETEHGGTIEPDTIVNYMLENGVNGMPWEPLFEKYCRPRKKRQEPHNTMKIKLLS